MAYIDQHKQTFGVEPICAALRAEGIAVAPSGYYAAKKREPSRRALSDAALAEVIEATFWDRDKGRGVYGAQINDLTGQTDLAEQTGSPPSSRAWPACSATLSPTTPDCIERHRRRTP